MAESCQHLTQIADADTLPLANPADGCPECLAAGHNNWVHLRQCLSCGHVGCCDSSPRRHATAHFAASEHPLMRSIEPGETWRWCFVDQIIG